MNYVRIALGAVALTVVALAWGQYRQIGLQRQLISQQEDAIQAAIQRIDEVKDIVQRNDGLMTDLLTVQGEVHSSLSARQQEIRRLQNEVAEIRTWADQPLPADIARMRQRSAATGAGGYGQPMSAGSSVRAEGSQP